MTPEWLATVIQNMDLSPWEKNGKSLPPALLYEALGAIGAMIEKGGCHIELTKAGGLAFDLQRAIGNEHNPPDQVALGMAKRALAQFAEESKG